MFEAGIWQPSTEETKKVSPQEPMMKAHSAEQSESAPLIPQQRHNYEEELYEEVDVLLPVFRS